MNELSYAFVCVALTGLLALVLLRGRPKLDLTAADARKQSGKGFTPRYKRRVLKAIKHRAELGHSQMNLIDEDLWAYVNWADVRDWLSTLGYGVEKRWVANWSSPESGQASVICLRAGDQLEFSSDEFLSAPAKMTLRLVDQTSFGNKTQITLAGDRIS